jgi:hypothetical protein
MCPRRLGNNLAGQYKRGVGMALQIGIGNFGGAFASNIFRARDGPRYILGRAYASLPIYRHHPRYFVHTEPFFSCLLDRFSPPSVRASDRWAGVWVCGAV